MKKLRTITAVGLIFTMLCGSVTAFAAESSTHTVTLQKIAPVEEGEDYAWLITSERGQLASSIRALGLGNISSDLFDEEDVDAIFTQDTIDIDNICEKFGLNISRTSLNVSPITITYDQADVQEAIRTDSNEAYEEINEEPMLDTRGTRTIPRTTLEAEDGYYKSANEAKDDDEQCSYLTLTVLEPTAYAAFNGIYARIRIASGGTFTPWLNIRKTGRHELPFRSTIVAEKGDVCYLEITSDNEKATDIAGRWTA